MSVNVIQYLRRTHRSADWTNSELAEFYRAEGSLIRAGIPVETDRGLTDEGHPWFVFCRLDSGDVILHFARLDSGYLVASPVFGESVRGADFRSLITRVTGSLESLLPRTKSENIYTHPAAALIALVSICYFVSQNKEIVAAELKAADPTSSQSSLPAFPALAAEGQAIDLSESQASTVLAAIGIALTHSEVVSAATVDSAPAGSLEISVPDSIAPSSPTFVGALNDGQWIDHGAGSLTDLAYAGQANANQWLAVPPVDHGRPLSQVGSLLTPTIQTTAGADPEADLVFGANSSFQMPAHVSVERPVVHGPQSSSVSVASDFAPIAQSIDFGQIASMIDSIAGREVIAVLGASVETHMLTSMSAAKKDFLVNVVAEAKAPGNASDPSPSVAATAHSATAGDPHPTSSVASTSTAGDGKPTPNAESATESAMVTKDITLFEQAHPDFQLIDCGKEVIICDSHLTSSNYATAVQETFNFADGSSVLLIGLPAPNHTSAVV